MIKNFFICLISVFFGLLLMRCAQVAPLTGGKRDTTPPKLIEAIPAHKTIQFQVQDIVLKFDEFIKLKDAANQIEICPQLKIKPEYEVQGKTLKVKLLNQFLEPGTTYRIDFGNAITDMHEGNVLEGFEYVFSTGPFIDSLKIKGTVTLAFNNKSVANALVGLYPNTARKDSLVFKVLPSYITKTNNNGEFNFYNLPIAKYFVYAVEDKNKNLLYDGESEQIAQLGPQLDLLSDTMIDMKMFKEDPNKSYIKRTLIRNYGFGQIILNKPALIKLQTRLPSQSLLLKESQVGKQKDTISFFYKSIEDTLSLVLENLQTSKIDTIKISIPKRQISKKSFIGLELNQSQGRLAYNKNPCLIFSNWMDTSHVKMNGVTLNSLTDSAIGKVSITGKWTSINTFELNTKLKEGISYQLKLKADVFNNIEGITNDSMAFQFKTRSKNEFGKFILKLAVTRKQNYVIQLLNEKEEVVKENALDYSVFASGSALIPFSEMEPGNYFVKIIFDNNQNKIWDKGDVLTGRLPEPIIISRKKIKILADWESEEEIILGEQN